MKGLFAAAKDVCIRITVVCVVGRPAVHITVSFNNIVLSQRELL